jgi:acyl-CoA thioesterase FadM
LEKDNVTNPTKADDTSIKTFQTKIKTYIEDTDTYGVLYHGNYIKYYERVLRSHYNDFQYVISNIETQTFRKSPTLGEEVTIIGQTIHHNVDDDQYVHNGSIIWNLKMIRDENNELLNEATVRVLFVPSMLHNTSQQNVQSTITVEDNNNSNRSEINIKKPHISKFIVHYDEMESFLFNSHHQNLSNSHNEFMNYQHIKILPIRSTLNFLERDRTNLLGGPDILEQMKTLDGIIFVVTRISDVSIFDCCRTMTHNNSNHKNKVLDSDEEASSISSPTVSTTKIVTSHLVIDPLSEISVISNISVKRKKVVEFCSKLVVANNSEPQQKHETMNGKQNSGENVIAKGIVTIMCLDAKSFKPKEVPENLLQKWSKYGYI